MPALFIGAFEKDLLPIGVLESLAVSSKERWALHSQTKSAFAEIIPYNSNLYHPLQRQVDRRAAYFMAPPS
jgi:hypothetical protein